MDSRSQLSPMGPTGDPSLHSPVDPPTTARGTSHHPRIKGPIFRLSLHGHTKAISLGKVSIRLIRTWPVNSPSGTQVAAPPENGPLLELGYFTMWPMLLHSNWFQLPEFLVARDSQLILILNWFGICKYEHVVQISPSELRDLTFLWTQSHVV